MNLQEQTYRIKSLISKMGGITESNTHGRSLGNYKSFSELTDKDLYDIAIWGLNDEYKDSSCETPECVVKDFKQFLNTPFPEELGNIPEKITIYRLIRLNTINNLNKTNLGKSWFSIPDQYEKKNFYDNLDYLQIKTTDNGDIYLITATTNQSNIDIPRTLWQRSTQWFENEIVINDDTKLNLLKIIKI